MNILLALTTTAVLVTAPPPEIPLKPPAPKPVLEQKKPFKLKHPKVCKFAHKFHTVAVFCKPFVEVAGSTAQILLYAVPRR